MKDQADLLHIISIMHMALAQIEHRRDPVSVRIAYHLVQGQFRNLAEILEIEDLERDLTDAELTDVAFPWPIR